MSRGRDVPGTFRVRRRILLVRGQVQGVGFRPFVFRLARSLGLEGQVRNDPAGVTIEALGDHDALEAFATRLSLEAPPLACVEDIRCTEDTPGQRSGTAFRIVASADASALRGRVTVDSAACDECVREILDPEERRYRHGLANCTNCGPRYTIVADLPYDRGNTTMAPFPMCHACEAEYRDPANRRFHAQPTCCNDCGPRVRLVDATGRELEGDPWRGAADLLRAGRVVAMKGLGGYHLVADATEESAVRRLRAGKKRDHKPFALMTRDVAAAGRLVRLSAAATTHLTSPARPIVLAERKKEARVADAVAPGVHRLGVMLPYTPMQHVLLAEGLGPLVMTSANTSDDPLLADDEEVRASLGAISDAFLLHDRRIERAVDDSVVLDTSRGIVPLRRARGYVPEPISLPVASPAAGICVGGDLKNTVAIVRGTEVVLSHHLGDLGYTLAWRRFERTIEDLCRLYDVAPRWIACDAHPDYRSRAWALAAARERGIEVFEIQHHHAHLASLLAERGRTERTIGLLLDGVGYGADGTAWGGEVLVGDLTGFERVGRLRPLRLPGGDRAARETGRCALSWLHDLLGPEAAGHPAGAVAMPDPGRRAAVARLLDADVNCPRSSGAGRLFDAAAALLGACPYNHYEAMSGMRLEALGYAATECRPGDGLVRVRRATDAGPFELDPRPLLEAVLRGIAEGDGDEELAYLFHDALAAGLAEAARQAAETHACDAIALSGGVFANALLTDRLVGRLERDGLDVLRHAVVPPNDGGLALGQAAIAAIAAIGAIAATGRRISN